MEKTMAKPFFTESRNPDTADIDLMTGEQIAQTLNNEDKKVALAVEKCIPQIGQAIELIAKSFSLGGRLGYFGAGTSGRLGVLDASECWPTFGVEHGMVNGFIAGGDAALRLSVEDSEDSFALGLADIQTFNPGANDVVVAISSSGAPQYLLTVLQEAHKCGAATIALSCNPDAPIKGLADIFINPVVGPEPIAGSSRMKAGTAQKMVLNMLSTGAMIRIGKTYQNYMIDVRMVNAKLIERGRRIVSEIAGISPEEAAAYLEAAEQKVKTACLMALKKISRSEAEKQLKQAGGILRKAIG